MKNIRTPHQKYLLGVKKNKAKILILQVSILIAAILFWELFAQWGIIDPFIMSCPSRILRMFRQLLKQKIFMHIGITLAECIAGFVLSTALGVAIAIGLWWSPTVRRILEPYLVVLNSLPKVALGPIIIVWAGASAKAIIVMAVLICIIVTIISVLNGFLSCDEGKILLLRSMGATKFQILYKLILPYSLPNFLSVLKVNIGLAWVGTIMGEYLTSGAGLGYLIIYGGQVFKMDLVMASVVILCVLAAGMYLGVAVLEKRLRKHR